MLPNFMLIGCTHTHTNTHSSLSLNMTPNMLWFLTEVCMFDLPFSTRFLCLMEPQSHSLSDYESMSCNLDFISDTDTWQRCLVEVRLILQVINSSWPESSSFSSAGLLWGWRWKGIHLQGAKVHPAVWDFPEAPQALLRQVWSGERQDHPGLWQGERCLSDCESGGLWLLRSKENMLLSLSVRCVIYLL